MVVPAHPAAVQEALFHCVQIMQLTSLHILDLSNTCLSGLPPTLAALTSLQELLLGACCFRRVPAALLRRLDSLQVLDMSRNTELELEGLSVDDLTWVAQGAPGHAFVDV